MKNYILSFAMLIFIQVTFAIERPFIWVSKSDRQEILEKIEKYDWANTLFMNLHKKVDTYVDRHHENPEWILSRIPKTYGLTIDNQFYNFNKSTSTIDKVVNYKIEDEIGKIPLLFRINENIKPKDSKKHNLLVPKLDEIIPFNTHPSGGMTLKDKNGNETEVPYLGAYLRNIYTDILTKAFDSAVLYYLTEDKKYAKFSADILYSFLQSLNEMEKFDDDFNGSILIFDNHLKEARVYGQKFPIIYDLIHPYLKSNGEVYDAFFKKKTKFDFDIAENVFEKYVKMALETGIIDCNWPVLESPSLLYNTLALSDEKKREKYFNLYYSEGTEHQDSFLTSSDLVTSEGYWPESLSYNAGVMNITLRLLKVINNYKPKLHIIEKNKKFLKGAFAFKSLEFPNSEVIRYGDSHRTVYAPVDGFEFVKVLAKQADLQDLETEAESFISEYIKKNGNEYKTDVKNQTLIYINTLKLLWFQDVDTKKYGDYAYDFKPINTVTHAGIVVQRNLNTSDKKKYGLMGFQGGATYVHAHASGIDMELYGRGEVLGSEAGKGIYGTTLHERYYKNYAGHNTVVINGTSTSDSKKEWYGLMNTTKLVSSEPKPLEDAVSKDFTYSLSQLDDKINKAKQTRMLGIVRTSDSTGYYLDVFRSKALGENKFHDYIYHNIGDKLKVFKTQTSKTPLELDSTPNRFQNDVGNIKQSPGWRYFEDVYTSKKTDVGIKARFRIMNHQPALCMNLLVVASPDREYSSVLAPETLESVKPYNKRKTPVFAARQYGEAWKRPFMTVYEPQDGIDATVKTAVAKYSDDLGNQVLEVTSVVAGKKIVDLIFIGLNSSSKINYDDYKFQGTYAVLRFIDGKKQELYIGNGEYFKIKRKNYRSNDAKLLQMF